MSDSFFEYNNLKITKKIWLYFLAVFVVNFLFKIIYLDFSSLWYDEIISVQSALLDFGHIKHVSEWDKNPPFYYYCLSVWVKLFNSSEFCVRILSVVFSSAAAGVLFLLANKLFNKTTAIIVSVLYLSSNIIYFYSHEARAYSLIVLLSLISTYLFFNFKDKPSYKNIFLLGLINFLLIYSHYISGLVLVIQIAFALIYFDREGKIKFSYSVLIVCLLVLLRFTKKQVMLVIDFNGANSTFWLKKSDYNYLIEMISSFLFQPIFVLPLLGLIAFGVFFMFRYKLKQLNLAFIYCILIGFGSIIFVFFLGKITPVFLDRYLLFTIPFILMLVAFALSFIKDQYISVSLALVFFIFSAFNINYKTEKQMDYKGAVSFVKTNKEIDDLVIVKTKDIRALFCYYYNHDFFLQRKEEFNKEENVIFCNSWDDVYVDVNNFKRIIILDTFHELNPNENEFVTKLSQHKKYKAESNYYKGVRISFYK